MTDELLIILIVLLVLAVPTLAAIIALSRHKSRVLPLPVPTEKIQQDAQTEPQVYAELECATQCPLDVVFLVDSSQSVTEVGFRNCIKFLNCVTAELEMPPVNAGLVRFHGKHSIISDLTGEKDAFLTALAGMAYEAGETRLAAPLRCAADMLRSTAPHRKKVIVVITDGEPLDLPETQRVAKSCKDQGTELIFVATGPEIQMETVKQLASSPWEKYVLELANYDELASSSAAVALLKCIVEVSMRIRRAKCAVNLYDFTCADLSTVDGWDMMVPGWQQKSSTRWSWEPSPHIHLEDSVVQWSEELATRAARSVPWQTTPQSPSHATQTEVYALPQSTQTVLPLPEKGVDQGVGPSSVRDMSDKLFKVQLGQWQNAPLDLVVCLDSSASFFLARKTPASVMGTLDPSAFSESGAFQQAKAFVDVLAKKASFPGVRLGLIRFDDEEEVVCPLTSDTEDFLQKLQEMKPATGETKFTPALRRAWHLLSTPHAHSTGFGDPVIPSRAVLVITDGDPNDRQEAVSAVAMFRRANMQVLFLKVGQAGLSDCLDSLAVVQPPPGSSSSGPAAPTAQGVFRTSADESTGLLDSERLAPQILSQVLWAIRPVARARCLVPLSTKTCEVVGEAEDLSGTAGLELFLPNLTPPLDKRYALWDPSVLPAPDTMVQTMRPMTVPAADPTPVPAFPHAVPPAMSSSSRRPKELALCTSCEVAARVRLELKQQLADAEAQISSLKLQVQNSSPPAVGPAGDSKGDTSGLLAAFVKLRSEVEEAEKGKAAAEEKANTASGQLKELRSEVERLKSELEKATQASSDSQQRALKAEGELTVAKAKAETEARERGLLKERSDAAQKEVAAAQKDAAAGKQTAQELKVERDLLQKQVAELQAKLESAEHSAKAYMMQNVQTLSQKNEQLNKGQADRDGLLAANLLLQERVEKMEFEAQELRKGMRHLKQENDDLAFNLRQGGADSLSPKGGGGGLRPALGGGAVGLRGRMVTIDPDQSAASTAVPSGSLWQSLSQMELQQHSPASQGNSPMANLTQDSGEMLWVHKAELRRCLDEWESALNRADEVEGQNRTLEGRLVRLMVDGPAPPADAKFSYVTLRHWLDGLSGPLATPVVMTA